MVALLDGYGSFWLEPFCLFAPKTDTTKRQKLWFCHIFCGYFVFFVFWCYFVHRSAPSLSIGCSCYFHVHPQISSSVGSSSCVAGMLMVKKRISSIWEITIMKISHVYIFDQSLKTMQNDVRWLAHTSSILGYSIGDEHHVHSAFD